MRARTLDRIEMGRQVYENTGSCLEDEFIGHIDQTKYNEMAYKLLNSDKIKSIQETTDNDAKFAKLLQIKEEAQNYFQDSSVWKERNNYINYKEAMRLVEACQIGDPEKPSRQFSRSLYDYIKNRFEDKYTLKFFTATGGSHLDIRHGVDCFFKLYQADDAGKLKELAAASIDLTMRANKMETRANVLFNISSEDRDKYDKSPANNNFDQQFFDQQITNFGEQVIQALIDNYQTRK